MSYDIKNMEIKMICDNDGFFYDLMQPLQGTLFRYKLDPLVTFLFPVLA